MAPTWKHDCVCPASAAYEYVPDYQAEPRNYQHVFADAPCDCGGGGSVEWSLDCHCDKQDEQEGIAVLHPCQYDRPWVQPVYEPPQQDDVVWVCCCGGHHQEPSLEKEDSSPVYTGTAYPGGLTFPEVPSSERSTRTQPTGPVRTATPDIRDEDTAGDVAKRVREELPAVSGTSSRSSDVPGDGGITTPEETPLQSREGTRQPTLEDALSIISSYVDGRGTDAKPPSRRPAGERVMDSEEEQEEEEEDPEMRDRLPTDEEIQALTLISKAIHGSSAFSRASKPKSRANYGRPPSSYMTARAFTTFGSDRSRQTKGSRQTTREETSSTASARQTAASGSPYPQSPYSSTRSADVRSTAASSTRGIPSEVRQTATEFRSGESVQPDRVDVSSRLASQQHSGEGRGQTTVDRSRVQSTVPESGSAFTVVGSLAEDGASSGPSLRRSGTSTRQSIRATGTSEAAFPSSMRRPPTREESQVSTRRLTDEEKNALSVIAASLEGRSVRSEADYDPDAARFTEPPKSRTSRRASDEERQALSLIKSVVEGQSRAPSRPGEGRPSYRSTMSQNRITGRQTDARPSVQSPQRLRVLSSGQDGKPSIYVVQPSVDDSKPATLKEIARPVFSALSDRSVKSVLSSPGLSRSDRSVRSVRPTSAQPTPEQRALNLISSAFAGSTPETSRATAKPTILSSTRGTKSRRTTMQELRALSVVTAALEGQSMRDVPSDLSIITSEPSVSRQQVSFRPPEDANRALTVIEAAIEGLPMSEMEAVRSTTHVDPHESVRSGRREKRTRRAISILTASVLGVPLSAVDPELADDEPPHPQARKATAEEELALSIIAAALDKKEAKKEDDDEEDEDESSSSCYCPPPPCAWWFPPPPCCNFRSPAGVFDCSASQPGASSGCACCRSPCMLACCPNACKCSAEERYSARKCGCKCCCNCSSKCDCDFKRDYKGKSKGSCKEGSKASCKCNCKCSQCRGDRRRYQEVSEEAQAAEPEREESATAAAAAACSCSEADAAWTSCTQRWGAARPSTCRCCARGLWRQARATSRCCRPAVDGCQCACCQRKPKKTDPDIGDRIVLNGKKTEFSKRKLHDAEVEIKELVEGQNAEDKPRRIVLEFHRQPRRRRSPGDTDERKQNAMGRGQTCACLSAGRRSVRRHNRSKSCGAVEAAAAAAEAAAEAASVAFHDQCSRTRAYRTYAHSRRYM